MTAPELKPCPFCGAVDPEWLASHVVCDCGATGPRQDVDREYQADAMRALTDWNRRADLAAVPAQVKVKPLVWSEVDGDEYAEVCGLVYILYEPSACDETNGWYVLEETTNTAIEADGSIEAAKAAAQADYESRILAAIEPQPISKSADLHDPRDEVIKGLVEAVEDVMNGENWRMGQKFDANSGSFDLSVQRAALAAAKAVQHG